MIGAVVLAAGAGRRLGGVAKATLAIEGQSFLERIDSIGRSVGVEEWLVVVGEPHRLVTAREAERLQMHAVVNPDPSRGMASSVAVGFAEAVGRLSAETAFLWPVDHPRVAASTLRTLALRADETSVVVPSHSGRGGHPPLVGRDLWPALAACGDVPGGARSVLRRLDHRVVRVPVDDPGVISDVDTPEAIP